MAAFTLTDLKRGDMVAVNAPELGGGAVGMYVVQQPALANGTALVLPAGDLAYTRHLRIRAEHVFAHFRAASVSGGVLAEFIEEVPANRAALKVSELAALAEAEALAERIAIVVPDGGTSPLELTRRPLVRRFTPVDGLVWMSAPEAHSMVSESNWQVATPAQVKAWKSRQRAVGRPEEAPMTAISWATGFGR